MAQSSSRGVGSGDPMSFYIHDLYTITETEIRSVHSHSQRMSIDGENSSTRSSGYLTALPRWESIKSAHRPRIHVPVPIIPKLAHIRKESQTPILEKDALAKEAGIQRSDSQKSKARSGASSPTDENQPRLGRTAIWLIIIVFVILILAVILGPVLGTFLDRGPSGPQPSVTEIPAGTTPTPTAPAPGTSGDPPPPVATSHVASISATGWSVSGSAGYLSLWLFWQNTEGYLSRAAYNSSTGNWTRVTNFAEAKRGTPLAATALNADWYEGDENYTFPGVHYQTSITYLDGNNYLKEWIFPDAGPEIGQPGPLNQQKYIAHKDTKIASYWPRIFYQGMSGEIRGLHFACHEKNECWHERVVSVTEARNGTQLIAVPTGNNLTSLAIFYQEEDGRFLQYREDSDEVGGLWENGAFSHSIPQNASVTAFSTTRSNDANDTSLNTYLLWQDANSTIQMSWSDSDRGWKGPMTYPAFSGAENNTALTCMTGLTFPNAPLQAGTELARCYFQTGNALREVSFDGDSWNVISVVPVDF